MKLVENKRKIISAVLALTSLSVMVLQLASCGGSSSKTTSATTTTNQSALGNQSSTTTIIATATTVATPANVTVTSADGIVSISVPSGWNLSDTALYSGSVIGVANDANSEYVIITEPAKTDYGANSTVSDYMNVIQSVFGAVLTNPVWGQSSNVTIGGCTGISAQLTGTRISDGSNMVYYVNALASKSYYYNVCGYTTSTMASSNQAQLETIIKSFKETN